jgi:hypothetical protein
MFRAMDFSALTLRIHGVDAAPLYLTNVFLRVSITV